MLLSSLDGLIPTALFIGFQFQIWIFRCYYYLTSLGFNSPFAWMIQALQTSCFIYQFYLNNYINSVFAFEQK